MTNVTHFVRPSAAILVVIAQVAVDRVGTEPSPYLVRSTEGLDVVIIPETDEVLITRCVLSGSCPQLLDAPLRTSQRPVDREGVGVGCYFGRDPGSQSHEGGRERLAQAEYPLQAGDGDLPTRCLTPRRRADGSVTRRMSTSAKASFNPSLR